MITRIALSASEQTIIGGRVMTEVLLDTFIGTDNPDAIDLVEPNIFALGGDDSIAADVDFTIYIHGGPGQDFINFPSPSSSVSVDLDAQSVNDGVISLISIENINATPFDDSLVGSDDGNVIFGNGGSDTIMGLGGDDLIDGGTDLDVIDGGAGSDTIFGGDNLDVIDGGDGDDYIDGGFGLGLFTGGAGNDTIVGGPLPDTVDYRPLNSSQATILTGSKPGEFIIQSPGDEEDLLIAIDRLRFTDQDIELPSNLKEWIPGIEIDTSPLFPEVGEPLMTDFLTFGY